MKDTQPTGPPAGLQKVGEALASLPPEFEIPAADTPPGRILRAAREIVAEQGLEDLTMRAVAGRAEVNLALIHYYFGSKEKLVHATIRSEILATQRDVFGILDSNLDVPALFIQFPVSIVEVMRRDPIRVRLLRRVLGSSPERLSRAIGELGTHGLLGASRVLLDMIARAQAAGQLPAMEARSILLHMLASAYGLVMVEPVAHALLGFSLQDQDLWRDHRANLERLLRDGLCAEEGKEN